MNEWRLIGGGVRQHPAAALLVLLTIGTAFLLYGLLAPVVRAMAEDTPGGGEQQLVAMHKVSPVELLPLPHKQAMVRAPGVERVTHTTWFGGYYQDLNQQRPVWAVDAMDYLAMHPQLRIEDPSALERWLARPNGVAIGRKAAESLGLEPGDPLPLSTYIWTQLDGDATWQLEVSAIVDGDEHADLDQLWLHYEYFDERRAFGGGHVGFFIIELQPGADPGRTAEHIDALFANSAAPTRTATLKSFLRIFSEQLGGLGAIVGGVLGLAFLVTTLMVCSHFLHSHAQRRQEWWLLKALGYPERRLAAYVVAEIGLMLLIGWALGSLLAAELVAMVGPAVAEFLPGLEYRGRDGVAALMIAAAVTAIAAVLPLKAVRRLRLAAPAGHWGRA